MTMRFQKNQTPKKYIFFELQKKSWFLNFEWQILQIRKISDFKKWFFFKKVILEKKRKHIFWIRFFFRSRIFWGEYSFDVEKSDLSISDGFRAFRARQVCFPEQSPCVSHSYAARGSVNDQNQWKWLLRLAPEPVRDQSSSICKPEKSQRQKCPDLDSAPV